MQQTVLLYNLTIIYLQCINAPLDSFSFKDVVLGIISKFQRSAILEITYKYFAACTAQIIANVRKHLVQNARNATK
jgi:hypothetical protein